jgi:hypothetical protein
METKIEYEIGDVIGFLSYGLFRSGRVTAKSDSRFSAVNEKGFESSGFNSQIIKVYKKEEK